MPIPRDLNGISQFHPERVDVQDGHHFVLPTSCEEEILKLSYADRERISFKDVEAFMLSIRRKRKRENPATNDQAVSAIHHEALWLDARELSEQQAMTAYHVVIGTRHLAKMKHLLQDCVIGLDGSWLQKDPSDSAVLSLTLVEKSRRHVFLLAVDITRSESEEAATTFLETVKAQVEEVLGVQDGAQQIWRPSVCTIDKSAALRSAVRRVFPATKLSVCMFHGHRAIHSHIRGLLPHSPIVTTLDGKRLPYSRTTAGVKIINAFKGLKMSRDAGELLEKKEKLYENLFPQLMSNDIAVRLKEYFEQHWFNPNWRKHWVSYELNDGFMEQVEWASNNHSESMFAKFKSARMNKPLTTSFSSVVKFCCNHVEKEDTSAESLLHEDYGQHNLYNVRNSPIVTAALSLRRKELQPMMARPLSLESNGDRHVLRYQQRVEEAAVDGRTYTHRQRSQELNTRSEETHCECGAMQHHNGRPCVHWLAWWIVCYVDNADGISTKDWSRMINYMRLIARQAVDRTMIREIIKLERQLLSRQRRLQREAQARLPPTVDARQQQQSMPMTWLPWQADGSCRLPMRGENPNSNMVNAFLTGMFSALDAAQVNMASVDEAPYFNKLLASQGYMSQCSFLDMRQEWMPTVQRPASDASRTPDMFTDILHPLCQANDTVLDTLLSRGYIFSCTCSFNASTCPAGRRGIIGAWQDSSRYPQLVRLPALCDTVQELFETATEKCCCRRGRVSHSASDGRHRKPSYACEEFRTRCSERESDAMQRQKKICTKCFQPASTTNCAHCFQGILCAEPKTTTNGLRSTPGRQSDDSDSCDCQQSRTTFSQSVHNMVSAIHRPSK